MDDNLVCSDLCEENGFTRQAEILRAISGERRTAYVVVERGYEYNDEIYEPHEAGQPSLIFLDPEAADRHATEREVEWHRHNNILDFCYRLEDVTDYKAPELEAKISVILGRPYHLTNDGHPTYARAEGPLIDGEATDDQMRRIAELFKFKWHYVIETSFAPGRPTPNP